MRSPNSIGRRRTLIVSVSALWFAGLLGGLVGLGVPLLANPSGAAESAHASIGANGPTVSADPTSGIGPDQWSYVALSNFPVGDTVTVSYCSNAAGSDLSDQPCDLASTSDVVILADGTAQTSIEVTEVDTSSVPITGDNGTNFFCTNADPCSIDVTDPSLSGSSVKSAANTAVVPVSFATSGATCPGAATVATASEYGLAQQLLSDSATLACNSAAPAAAFNTELDAVPTAQALASGNDQIAFVDDPDDPAVQSALGGATAHVAYIPVALTANVLGFKATESYDSNGNTSTFPDNSFDLTPTMVAGFVANVSSYQQQASPPPDPVPCTSGRPGTTCSLVTELNPPQGGFGLPSAYGALVRAGPSGSTFSLENWLCAVTSNVPVSLPGGGSVTEAETPGQTLADGFGKAGCPASDQFPALSTGGGNWFSEVSPAQQANKLESGLASQTSPSAFFAPMVWSEAYYNGLNVAALQNGTGAMVSPTTTSIDAALADATTDPNGTLSYDYADAKSAAAYPMPDVVYAVVSTDLVSAATTAAERSILSALLSESAPTATTALPGGFVPLTSALYAQGEAVLASALPQGGSPGSKATTPGVSGSTTGSGGIDLFGLLGDTGLSGGLGLLGLSPLAQALLHSILATSGANRSHNGALVIPTPLRMQLLAGDTSWLVPWFLRLLIAAALLGPLLLVAQQLARRRARALESKPGDAEGEDAVTSDPPALVDA